MIERDRIDMIEQGRESSDSTSELLKIQDISTRKSSSLFFLTVDLRHAILSQYGNADSFEMLASDIRTLTNGCQLPYRTIDYYFERTEGVKVVRSFSMWLLRNVTINRDLTEQCLHPVAPRHYIDVGGLSVKDGPSFFLEEGVPDAIAFVHGKMLQPGLVSRNRSWLKALLLMIPLIIGSLLLMKFFYRSRLS